jgi:membrane protein
MVVGAFVVSAAVAYRVVPAIRVSWRALLPPALLVGLTFAVFTQIFAFVTPRLVSGAAVYGAFVAAFVLLAWLSTGFTILMLGAAWTSVRVSAESERPVTTGEGTDDSAAARSDPDDAGTPAT